MVVSGTKWIEVGTPGFTSGVLYIKGELEHMFLGQYQHSLDEKGRLTIPSAYRCGLGEGAFITQGFERNLIVMSSTYFQSVYARVKTLNTTDSNARILRRLILSNAYQVEVDKAGRIVIPPKSRQFLGLDNEAVLVGVGEYFEIWAPADWEKQILVMENTEENAQRFAVLDLSAG
jgi:MraZ protein